MRATCSGSAWRIVRRTGSWSIGDHRPDDVTVVTTIESAHFSVNDNDAD